jgi:hypothetical protein
MVAKLREKRSDDDFVVSLRVTWDVTSMEPGAMAEEVETYRQAGIGALHIAPDRGDIEQWIKGQERVAQALFG